MSSSASALIERQMEALKSEWVTNEDGLRVHLVSGGVCPEQVDGFKLTKAEHELHPDGPPGVYSFRPFCRYDQIDGEDWITRFFYRQPGVDLKAHMGQIMLTMMSLKALRLRDEPSQLCDFKMAHISTLDEVGGPDPASAGATDEIGIGFDGNLEGRCIIADERYDLKRTYRTLDEANGWFYVTMLDQHTAGDSQDEFLIKPLLELYAAQRKVALSAEDITKIAEFGADDQ